MRTTEQLACARQGTGTPSTRKMGLLATLSGRLGAKGTGALSPARLKTPMITLLVACSLALLTASASAAAPEPRLTIHSFAVPTRFSAEDNAGCAASLTVQFSVCDAYQVTATNVGAVATKEGVEVTLGDNLPAGVTVAKLTLYWSGPGAIAAGAKGIELSGFCTTSPVRCPLPFQLQPDDTLELMVYVTVNEPAPTEPLTLTNEAFVSGGGAAEASTTAQNPLGGPLPVFGASVSSTVTGPDGLPDAQAAAHPYELSTRIDFNNEFRVRPDAVFNATSVQDPRDVAVDLPLGFLGSALATPTCTFAELSSHIGVGVTGCPADTVIGHILTEPVNGDSVEGAIYNMVPEHGVAAEFGFVDVLAGSHVIYANVAPTAAGYVLRTLAPEISQVPLTDIVATFFGDPAVRDAGSICGTGSEPKELSCREALESAQTPTFTNPSQCSGKPLSTAVHIDSWQHPGAPSPEVTGPGWVTSEAPTFPEGLTGCDLLQFDPSMSVQPEPDVPGAADSPAGLSVDIRLPQFEETSTLGTPPLRDAVVTLPQGLTVDPSSASGLQACSEAQIGFTGVDEATETDEFTPEKPTCPKASRIGTVELETPLLHGILHGSVYLAAQDANPFGSLLAGYIVVDDPTTGTIVKIPGELKANETTGQITGVFKNNPQFPFSELRLKFKGGSRGVLATPEACGTYTSTAGLTPWSAPDTGKEPVALSDSFQITGGCVSAFTPAFSAGTVSNQAGGFSPFTLSLSKQDDEQGLGGLTVNLPTGLIGRIAGVAECSDAQVAAAEARKNPGEGAAEQSSPSCPESSLLGTVTTAAGPGPNPYSVTGKAYLTGPYKGAPYGVAVIVPALAGPFDLGVVVIRQALYINPNDTHVTDVSDPFPTIRDGIPLRIQRVNVNLNRPNFTLNPTSCETKSITATATSTTGTPAALSSPYQAAGCASLPFAPKLTASTNGKTSKLNGASLHVKIVSAGIGQAGIAKVDLTIPSILPSRLTTLQKACTEAQFNANPAGCPSASLIATATVHTPLLPDPLSGPVYFVSHGGAAFPDTEIILQGDNVELILDGHTQIKNAITYSRFEAVPDAPFTTFEFNAPQGPFSVFGANANLCQTEVHMPTTITAQNGAVLTQSTLVEPEGCANKLTILSHTVKKRTITLKVAVPGAGKLTATGKGLSKATKTAGGRGIVTLTLKAKGSAKLKTKVKVSFAPTKGKKLSATVAAKFKR